MNNLTFEHVDVDLHRDFLIQAHRETSKITFGNPFDDEVIAREIERNANCTGVFLDGVLVGISDIEVRESDGYSYGWVHFFYLAPHLRGIGLSGQLVAHAEDFCREHGLKNLGLRTGKSNLAARKLYEKCGFSRNPEYDREPEIGYVKFLNK